VQAQTSAKTTFDVSSVKESKAGTEGGGMFFGADGCTIRNMPLKPIISSSFGIRIELISGLPNWTDTTHFDIEAKDDEITMAALAKLSNEENTAQLMLMMQNLLKERFKLKVTTVDKVIPTYELVVAKNGPKLKLAEPNHNYATGIKGLDGSSGRGMLMFGHGQAVGQAVSMMRFARNLANQAGRPVVDKTGLDGTYDFTFKWNPDDNVADSDQPTFLRL
jgi:uncharacterized protein (TIGR03435 family)